MDWFLRFLLGLDATPEDQHRVATFVRELHMRQVEGTARNWHRRRRWLLRAILEDPHILVHELERWAFGEQSRDGSRPDPPLGCPIARSDCPLYHPPPTRGTTSPSRRDGVPQGENAKLPGEVLPVEFVVRSGARRDALKNLRDWLSSANKVVIADPYFLQGEGWKKMKPPERTLYAEKYAKEAHATLGQVQTLEIFHLPAAPKEMLAAMTEITFRERNYRCWETTEIHDRVWIRDDNEARVVGTSFGGLGVRKLAFVLPLPDEDLAAFKDELAKIQAGEPQLTNT